MNFTDALDNYLEAKKVYDEAEATYEGWDFECFYYRECKRFKEAKDVLNQFFEPKE